MLSLKRLSAATVLLLGVCGAANAAEITGNFTNAQTAKPWSFSVHNLPWDNSIDGGVPTMDGTGWLTLHNNESDDEVTYAAANTLIDSALPIRITYEWFSHTAKSFEPRVAGFLLTDPTKPSDLHLADGDCTANFLTVAFQRVGMFAENCQGPQSPWNKTNYAIVRGTTGIVRAAVAPMLLTCQNYDKWGGTRVEAEHCATREQAVAKNFIRRVDAVLTPKLNRAGFTMDLKVDDVPVYSDVDIAQATPAQLRFSLFSATSSNGSVIEARNVRITQVAMFASEVNDRCASVEDVGGALTLRAAACTGTGTQVFRRDGSLLRVGVLCLTANSDGSLTAALCRGLTNQRWDLLGDGLLRARPALTSHTVTPTSGRCIALGQDGTSLSLQTCNVNAEAQRFHAVAP